MLSNIRENRQKSANEKKGAAKDGEASDNSVESSEEE
jgi:hypothetical protein